MEILEETQRERLAKVHGVLGDETVLRFFLDEVLWTALDLSKILRPGAGEKFDRQERIVARVGQLTAKIEMVKACRWMVAVRVKKTLEEAIKELEKFASERVAQNERRKTG